MYHNIGSKVKALAVFTFAVGVIASLIGAIIMWVSDLIAAGFGELIAGCIAAWIGSWVVYCIGETNEKTTELQKQVKEVQQMLQDTDQKKKAQNAPTVIPVTTNIPPTKPVINTEEKDRKSTGDACRSNGHAQAIPVDGEREKCANCGTVQNLSLIHI